MRQIFTVYLIICSVVLTLSAQKSKKPRRPLIQNLPVKLSNPPILPMRISKVSNVTGDVTRYENFPSQNVETRNIDVWLPPDYAQNSLKRYSVIYLHDGQNLFSPTDATGGVDWDVDAAMTRLNSERKVRETIVVAIWNTARRIVEFSPRKALEINQRKNIKASPLVKQGEGESDKYLRFLVNEVKPFIDKTYRTNLAQSETFIMGSSMGGLVSLYAICEYPNVFGGAAALSPQFILGRGIFLDYLKSALPSPKNHKIYLDYGTLGYDAQNSEFQKPAEDIFKKKGYKNTKTFMSLLFQGADHTEAYWQNRIETPLTFLLKR